jgi:hypothetical protein
MTKGAVGGAEMVKRTEFRGRVPSLRILGRSELRVERTEFRGRVLVGGETLCMMWIL